jgi:hypothetical protein
MLSPNWVGISALLLTASKEAVTKVHENWKGEESEKELRRMLGKPLGKKFFRAAKS